MSGPIVNVFAVPTGGAVRFEMPEYIGGVSGVSYMALARALSSVSGTGSFTVFYSGAPQPAYVDCGDGTPAPLASGASYVWNVTDDRGTTQVGPLATASSVTTQPDYLTNVLIRLLQGAINCLTLPAGFAAPGSSPVQVTTQMPTGGWQALPFIVVNLDLIQQTEVQIGGDVVNPNIQNKWTLWENCKRIWRISVFSSDANERDFYRDSLLAIYRVLVATVFSAIGYNVSHSLQATSGTDAKEWDGHTPGFFYAEAMFELDGIFNVTVTTNYGVIEKVTSIATIISNNQTIDVPKSTA